MTTTAPSADRMKAIPPTVNPNDIALSFRKPRFSGSPYTMLSVLNSAFIAAFALQSDTIRPIAKANPSVWLPFDATRVSCSRTTSTAPPGMKTETSSRCFAILAGSENSP